MKLEISTLKLEIWYSFVSANMDIDDTFVFEQGLQDMTGTYNFTSWVSLPHFLYGNDDIRDLYGMIPNEDEHRPYVSICSGYGSWITTTHQEQLISFITILVLGSIP